MSLTNVPCRVCPIAVSPNNSDQLYPELLFALAPVNHRPPPPTVLKRMEDGGAVWDLNTISEEDFDQLAVYQVQDKSAEEIEVAAKPNPNLCRAEASLPRNIILKPSQEKHTDVSIFFLHYCTVLALASFFAHRLNKLRLLTKFYRYL